MKGDIGMANYEKQVEQEAAYPIPSLVPRPSPLSAHYTRASCAHADSYARGRPGLKHHVR